MPVVYLTDVDECVVPLAAACICDPAVIGCVFSCTNTVGSYVCGCNNKAQLANDGFTCVGESGPWRYLFI